jgi:DNA-binding MarR family transcriptional regulator
VINLDFGRICRSLVAPHNWNPYRFASSTRENFQMSANQSLDQSDYQRLADFRYHLRGFLKFSERAASEMGLHPQQHQALLAIKGKPGGHVTIGILAERLGIRHNSMVELIDRLIMNGLVERRQNPKDRREVLIDLTNRAERILAKLSLAHRNEIRKLAPLLIRLLAPLESGPRKSGPRKRERKKHKT